MSSNYGKNIQIQIFGQSHSEAVGVVIDGLPAGKVLDLERIAAFLARRRGGQNAYSTKRSERDLPNIVSGLVDSKTCGAPLCAFFENADTKSGDYALFREQPRPSHADFNAHVKYKGANDIRGGGHFSGRLTLPLCFAGAVCLQFLEEQNIFVGAHIAAIAGIFDTPFDPCAVTKSTFSYDGFSVCDPAAGELMQAAIVEAAQTGDSVGGVVECAIIGLPQGVGEPMFDGLENKIAQIVFGIPAVKGVEFGAGFASACMRGSVNNDAYQFHTDGIVTSKTNHAGGIVGGISTGMPIIFRAAFKPTPSIARPQQTVNLRTGENAELIIGGRHDPCIVPRAVPCVEAAAAIAVFDLLLDYLK